MIKVTRIAGESYDFENRRETPKALILSNGKREFALYVDDATAEAVLEMMLESDTPEPKNGKPGVVVPTPEHPVMPTAKPAPRKTAPAPVHTFEKPAPSPPMVEIGGAAELEEEDDNSGFEPGEEYNDPATGAESL